MNLFLLILNLSYDESNKTNWLSKISVKNKAESKSIESYITTELTSFVYNWIRLQISGFSYAKLKKTKTIVHSKELELWVYTHAL